MPNPTQGQKADAFRALHEGAPFVIPNPWDAGSAKVLAGLGFKALATTSSGFAFTLGRPDGGATLDELVDHVRLLGDATDLPLSVDMENGYGADLEGVAKTVARIAEAGAVGGSVEDYGPGDGIYEIDRAGERVAAAVQAARRLDFPFTLTARAENHVRGNPDIDDTIARLQAYQRAGANVLFAPGLTSLEQVRAIAESVDRPLNVLAIPGHSLGEIAKAGAQRVSVGGRFTWTAVGAMAEAATRIRDHGDFTALHGPGEVSSWLST
jgi:2-methylisocitrate lyase-like PEP mutase family enzyme